jgi:predicted metal-binding protein
VAEATDLELFLERAHSLGATEAVVIDAGSVVTAAWVRMKCRYGCDGYGQSYCCPPHTPTPEETQRVLGCYRRAILIHCQGSGNPMLIAATLEREVFLSGYYKAFAFGSGPCRLCRTCAMDHCIHAEESRPAMEACGIDVFATARANGMPIAVVRDRSCEPNFYGLVLVD